MMLQQSWPLPSEMRPITIIGAGGIVNDAHLPAYRKAGFRVSGIFDNDHVRASETAQRWDIPNVYLSLDEAIAAATAEQGVFDLALPPSATAKVLESLPDKSCVLMQKPMGDNLAAARQITSICMRKNLTAAVNHQLRFAPYMLAVRDAYKRGLLGHMTDVEMQLNCSDPWEIFPFLKAMERVEIQVHSIHYLDLIRSLLGEPRGVYALTLPDSRYPDLASTRSSVILNYGSDTRVCLSLNHNYAHGSHGQRAHFRFEGDKGCIWVRLGVMLDYPKGQPDIFEIKLEGEDWQEIALEGGWFPEAFIGPMANLQRYAAGEDAELLTSAQDVLNTMKMIEAAYLSNAQGGVAPGEL